MHINRSRHIDGRQASQARCHLAQCSPSMPAPHTPPDMPHHLALASCRVLGSALLLWIPLMPLFFVLRQFLRSQAGTSK